MVIWTPRAERQRKMECTHRGRSEHWAERSIGHCPWRLECCSHTPRVCGSYQNRDVNQWRPWCQQGAGSCGCCAFYWRFWFQISRPRTLKENIFVVQCLLVCGCQLQKPEETNTVMSHALQYCSRILRDVICLLSFYILFLLSSFLSGKQRTTKAARTCTHSTSEPVLTGSVRFSPQSDDSSRSPWVLCLSPGWSWSRTEQNLMCQRLLTESDLEVINK